MGSNLKPGHKTRSESKNTSRNMTKNKIIKMKMSEETRWRMLCHETTQPGGNVDEDKPLFMQFHVFYKYYHP